MGNRIARYRRSDVRLDKHGNCSMTLTFAPRLRTWTITDIHEDKWLRRVGVCEGRPVVWSYSEKWWRFIDTMTPLCGQYQETERVPYSENTWANLHKQETSDGLRS